MSQDATKHLERARKSLEKNKLPEAIAEYQAALESAPGNAEAIQMLANLYVRTGDLVQAAHYFGLQFDSLADSGDTARASAIFSRYLKPYPQPPPRLMKYGFLLQKQNRVPEAIEFYTLAGDQFRDGQEAKPHFECLQKIAQLDPENASRQMQLAQAAEQLQEDETAGRAFLRAAQLTQAGGDADLSLQFFAHAHRLIPNDRSIALLYADARMHQGDAAGAVELLRPFTPADPADTAFLSLYGEALLQTGQLDPACEALIAIARQKPEGLEKLFDVASLYFRDGAEEKGIALLKQVKEWMFASHAELNFAAHADQIAETNSNSLALAEFTAKLYDELNREVKYFDCLVRLFDLYLAKSKITDACEALDKLVEIDPYDYRIHERISQLEGKASAAYLRNINVRAAKASSRSQVSQEVVGAGIFGGTESAEPAAEGKNQRGLDDLIVQAEIFLQYSLQSKAIERLERIAESFAGEESHNERLRMLYERANWWPRESRQKAAAARPASQPSAQPSPGLTSAADTHRDLAEIAEITRLMYREVTPREALGTAVREVGKYLNARRCVGVIDAPGDASPLVAEYAAPGMKPAGSTSVSKSAAALAKLPKDALGGIIADAKQSKDLRALDIDSVLGVQLTDRETQAAAGVLFAGDTASRQWKPNESYFLQAVGDQVMISVNHTRMRSLVRTLAVADEKSGLLGRSAYIDCLLAESKRSRIQNTPLALIILHLDHGPEILREQGESALEAHMNQLARAIESSMRQGDLGVKYTAWSLAFVLPDTSLEKAESLTAKLLKTGAKVQPEWARTPLTLSAVIADASSRSADENEDRVTEWINRAESGLDEVRRKGKGATLALAAPLPI